MTVDGCCTLTEIVLTRPDAQCTYPRVKALNVFCPLAGWFAEQGMYTQCHGSRRVFFDLFLLYLFQISFPIQIWEEMMGDPV